MLNQVTLVGNLTADPDLKYTPGGTAVAEFNLAMSRVWTNDQGEKQEATTFVQVKAWRESGEWAAKHLKKGVEAGVVGRLDLDRWDDPQTGQKRSKLYVTAERLFPTFGTWKDKQTGNHTPSDDSAAPSARTPATSYQRPASAPPSRKPNLTGSAPPPTPPPAKPRDPDLDPPEDDIPF